MDILRLVILLTFLATATVFGKEQDISDAKAENEIQSLSTSNNKETNMGYTNPDQLLHRSKKGTCGVPDPMCTTGCFNRNGCVCNQEIKGSYYYYTHRCRELSKICGKDEYELFDYTKISPQHSASLPTNPTCIIIRHGVAEEEKLQILDVHNTLRAKVARGEELRSPQQRVPQPGGANIKELRWNDELAYIAQKWANQCNYQHEVSSSRRTPCSRPYGYIGQNLYLGYGTGSILDNDWSQAITMWYDEVADLPITIVKKFSTGGILKKIGHYTQLVWAETYEIGCGAVYYKEWKYGYGTTNIYVCNYGPGGNMMGKEMYKIGQAATDCGKSGRSTKYPGLCATQLE